MAVSAMTATSNIANPNSITSRDATLVTWPPALNINQEARLWTLPFSYPPCSR